jgi:acetyl esterase/lipase
MKKFTPLLATLFAVISAFSQQAPSSVAEKPAAPKSSKGLLHGLKSLVAGTKTPATFPGAETHVYRDLDPEPLRLHVVKPAGWQSNERRPALIYFFGGGWTTGSTEKSIGWARMAAGWGMVGVAPDYRTALRFGTSPAEAVADARAAMRWVQDHAAELGVDPPRIVVAGGSAGGHLALWTAIEKAPPGSIPEESPRAKPAALVLLSAASDTSDPSLARRFGEHIADVSPLQHLDPAMPPVIAFHGDADTTVPYSVAVALRDKLVASGNVCQLVTAPGAGHGFKGREAEWKDKSRSMIVDFLTARKLLPVSATKTEKP